MSWAEENKEAWHWCMPFDRTTGKPLQNFEGEDYSVLTGELLLNKMKKDIIGCICDCGRFQVMLVFQKKLARKRETSILM